MITMYQQLCPVSFGSGAIAEIGVKANEFGAKNVLCIYDSGVKDSGVADRIIRYLEDSGMKVDTFDNVLPDAPDTRINEIGTQINGKGYDLVVGIGGGSSMDTAKAISVLTDHPLPIQKYLASSGVGPIRENKTKLILVPTTAGTGSEVTMMSVIHNTKLHFKDAVLRPADLAIVDPELTITVPPAVTAASALDALSHAIEAYTSADSNPKADLLALHAIKLIGNNIERAYNNGKDIDARTALCFASNIAGIAFSDASVHVGHCAAHELGLTFHISHGAACAIATPATIEFCADILPQKIFNIAKALGCEVTPNDSSNVLGQKAATQVRLLMKKTGIKSLKEMGLTRNQVLSCAEGAIKNNWFYIKAPKEIDVNEMEILLGIMYDKY